MNLEEFNIREFIRKYYPDFNDNEEQINNIQKQVKRLIDEIISDDGIYKKFPLQMFDKNEIGKFLYYIREKSNERQIISNMKKVNVGRSFEEFVVVDEQKYLVSKQLLKEFPNYEPWNIKRELMQNSYMIKNYSDVPQIILNDLYSVNEAIIRGLIWEKSLFKCMGLRYTNFYYIEDYIDYVVNELTDVLEYWIVNNFNMKNGIKEKYLKAIEDELLGFSEKIDYQISRTRKNNAKIKEQLKLEGIDYDFSIEEYTRFFSSYRERENYYNEYINIYKVLEKEEKNNIIFKEIESQYKTEKFKFLDGESEQYVKSIVTEGISVDRFKEKLKNTKEVIKLFQLYNISKANDESFQDLKVYFREIYMSKQKYNGKQTKTIIRNYLDESKKNGEVKFFEKKSDYMFLLEKLNRGYCREKDILVYYHKKNMVMTQIYKTILKVYLFYDYEDTLEIIYSLNYCIISKLKELFNN